MPARADAAAALLARVPAFEELGPAELAAVAAVVVPRRFEAGAAVFREGDASSSCYVVQRGPRARDPRASGRAPDHPGHVRPGRHLRRAGDVRRRARSATVEAIDDLEALAILGADMRRLMHEHADIAVKLAISLVRRLRNANERLARQSFLTVQSRVAAVLAQLSDQAAREGAGARDVQITATQADLAKLAGSSRESASRFLAVLERAGVISQGRGRLTIHDPEALQGYVY